MLRDLDKLLNWQGGKIHISWYHTKVRRSLVPFVHELFRKSFAIYFHLTVPARNVGHKNRAKAAQRIGSGVSVFN